MNQNICTLLIFLIKIKLNWNKKLYYLTSWYRMSHMFHYKRSSLLQNFQSFDRILEEKLLVPDNYFWIQAKQLQQRSTVDRLTICMQNCSICALYWLTEKVHYFSMTGISTTSFSRNASKPKMMPREPSTTSLKIVMLQA